MGNKMTGVNLPQGATVPSNFAIVRFRFIFSLFTEDVKLIPVWSDRYRRIRRDLRLRSVGGKLLSHDHSDHQ
jgi:hypothetical protein